MSDERQLLDKCCIVTGFQYLFLEVGKEKNMENKKTDRRVRYTKMVLKEAFVTLLQNKPVSKITIKELCEAADINRATFYAHYEDQYDLLEQIENEVVHGIQFYLEQEGHGRIAAGSLERMEKIFRFITENAETCKLLLGKHGDSRFRDKVTDIVKEECVCEWMKSKKLNQEEAEYIYLFAAIGCVGVIQKWLEGGMKKPPGEMAVFVLKLLGSGPAAFGG